MVKISCDIMSGVKISSLVQIVPYSPDFNRRHSLLLIRKK